MFRRDFYNVDGESFFVLVSLKKKQNQKTIGQRFQSTGLVQGHAWAREYENFRFRYLSGCARNPPCTWLTGWREGDASGLETQDLSPSTRRHVSKTSSPTLRLRVQPSPWVYFCMHTHVCVYVCVCERITQKKGMKGIQKAMPRT